MTVIKVVCFDLGGVLVRFAEACQRSGVPFRDADWMMTDEALSRRRAIIDSYQRGSLSTPGYFAALAAATEGRYTAVELEQVHDAWLVEEYQGVLDLIGALNEQPDLVTACLSNTNERHWRALAPSAPGSYPSVANLRQRLASHIIGKSKPDPRIYSHAERELGVRGSDILFFDDLATNVNAAREQGWRAERVDPKERTAEQMASHLAAHGVI